MCGIINSSFIYKIGFTFFNIQDGKFSSNSGRVHFEGLVHLFRYIRDSKNLGLRYFSNIEDVPLSNLLRQASIINDNQLIVFPDSIWQDFLDNFRSTGAYIVFNQSVSIDHCSTVSQLCADSE